jgi:hypothetical protein
MTGTCLRIVRDHLRTFRNTAGGMAVVGAAFFYGLGTMTAAWIVWGLHISYSEPALGTLATVISVLVALLLTTLTTVYGVLQVKRDSLSPAAAQVSDVAPLAEEAARHKLADRQKLKLLLIEDIFVNTSYAIVISVVCLLPIMVLFTLGPVIPGAAPTKTGTVATFAVSWFSIILVLTLLRVLEKVYTLLHCDIQDCRGPSVLK